MARRPKGYWLIRENCEGEALKIVKEAGWTEIPSRREIFRSGITETHLNKLGGRAGLSTLTGLPVRKITNGRPKQANIPALEKWEGKPSRAFEIEAEARKVGLSYADIQKQKTLAMVGGVLNG